MNKQTFKVFLGIIWILTILIFYYFALVPLNLQSPAFWFFMICALGLGAVLFYLDQLFITKKILFTKHIASYLAVATIVITLLGGIMLLYSLPVFHAKAYANLIEKQEGDFATDVDELPVSQIPTVDRDTALRLGDRKMGEIVELVSQFNVAPDYTQINYQGKPVRVSPLQYADFFKWFNNTKNGIPSYIRVDMVTGNVELVTPEKSIKYSESEYFFENVRRYLRIKYPTAIFGDFSFEIDEQGTPYWIVSVRHNTIGLFGGTDVKEVIMLNASTGEHQKLKVGEVPQWVDRVYDADLVIQQLNFNGRYQNGFINSIIGQKGVLATTEGYNYLALHDDVYLYTGITSVVRDESNIGFILVNMRTKETTFYSIPSAEEFSAMDSAQGAVQEKRYVSTFPLLLNIEDKPVYFMSLKDAAGLIKMYALVDAQDYQKVIVANTVEEAINTFTGRSKTGTEPVEEEPREEFAFAGKVTDIQAVVMDGNTYFYLLLEGQNDIYIANIKVSEKLPFLKIDNEISGYYVEKSRGVKEIVRLK